MYAINILSEICDDDSLIHVESSPSIVLQVEKKTNAFIDIFLLTIESVKLVDKSAICVSDKRRNFRIFASWLKNYEI